MTLAGFDIANVNGPGIITRALTGEFVIVKASEGMSFRDGYAQGWAARARGAGRLVGWYHYAHLANSPVTEADWFVGCASPARGETLWLDFEPYAQPVADAAFPGWAVAFLDRVNARVPGVSCGIYLNDDMGRRMMAHATPAQAARLHQAPLWKAAYAAAAGSLLGWQTITLWQWSGTGIDQDTCYGDAGTWARLGAGSHAPPPPPPIGFLMALTDAQQTELYDTVRELANIARTGRRDGSVTKWPFPFTPADAVLSQAQRNDQHAEARAASLTAVIAQLAGSNDLTIEQIKAALSEVVAASVHVSGTLDVTPKPSTS